MWWYRKNRDKVEKTIEVPSSYVIMSSVAGGAVLGLFIGGSIGAAVGAVIGLIAGWKSQ